MVEWALVVVTIGLVYATWQLVRYTKSLSVLTSELVRIENQREKRAERENRLREIKEAISFGESFLSIDLARFRTELTSYSQDPHPGKAALEWCRWVRGLHQHKQQFINNDLEATDSIDFLLYVADDVLDRRNNRSNDPQLGFHFERLRMRLFIIVNAWRHELAKLGVD